MQAISPGPPDTQRPVEARSRSYVSQLLCSSDRLVWPRNAIAAAVWYRWLTNGSEWWILGSAIRSSTS
jgi:hypothetical protein